MDFWGRRTGCHVGCDGTAIGFARGSVRSRQPSRAGVWRLRAERSSCARRTVTRLSRPVLRTRRVASPVVQRFGALVGKPRSLGRKACAGSGKNPACGWRLLRAGLESSLDCGLRYGKDQRLRTPEAGRAGMFPRLTDSGSSLSPRAASAGLGRVEQLPPLDLDQVRTPRNWQRPCQHEGWGEATATFNLS